MLVNKNFDLQKELLCEKKNREPKIKILLLDKNWG
jgi:hypothetical protein